MDRGRDAGGLCSGGRNEGRAGDREEVGGDGIAVAAPSVMPAQRGLADSGSRGDAAKVFPFVQGGVDFRKDRAFTNGTELTPLVIHADSVALFHTTQNFWRLAILGRVTLPGGCDSSA